MTGRSAREDAESPSDTEPPSDAKLPRGAKRDPFALPPPQRAPRWLLAMERVTSVLAALVCLLFAATLRDVSDASLWMSAQQAPSLPQDGSARDGELLVSVTDEDGTPVDNAHIRVFLLREDGTYLAGQANSDADGRALLGELPHGESWVIVERAGMARTSSRLVISKGQRRLELTLRPAETFEVVVVDPLQRPIAGASVALHGADPLPYRMKSDASGLARVSGVGPGPYAIDVKATGYSSKLIAHATLDDSPLFVKLERLGGLTVKLVTPGGKPVRNATVMVAGSALWPARSGTSDKKGQVTISGLPRGFYDVRAEKGDLVSRNDRGVLLERGETKEITIEMVKGLYIRVQVTDGEGDGRPPISGANVALVERGISSFPRYGRTDTSGWVELGPIASDDATVSARAPGFVARSAVPLEPDQREVKIGLLRGATLTGRVVDERDYPVAGAQMEIVGIDVYGIPIAESSMITGFRDDHFAFALPGAVPLIPAGELGVMPIVPDVPQEVGALRVERTQRTASPWVSGRDGHFKLSPVTPGRVRLVVRHPGYVETISDTVELAPGGKGELTIVLRRGGTLEGRVIEQDRTAVAGARIEISSPDGTTQRLTYAAEDGSFAFIGLPKDVVISVARPDAPELIAERLALKVPPDERTEIEIVLPRRREEVTLRVTDDGGYPIDRVQVRVSSLDPDEPLRRTLFTDDNGEAVAPEARGLSLRIELWRRGRAPHVSQIERASAQIDLAMTAGLSLEGIIDSRNGAVSGAEVTLLTATGARHAKSGQDGAFRIDDLALGGVRLRVSAQNYVVHEREMELAAEPGKPMDLGRIELLTAGSVEGVVRDERGDPLAGVRVAAGRVPTYLPLGEMPPGVTRTDQAGRFRLDGLEPGEVVLQAYKIGYGRQTSDTVRVHPGDVRSGVRIELEQDPDVDPTQPTPASLAVTMGELRDGGRRLIIFEHVPPGGEAERAGILAGDRLIAINGIRIRSLEQARRRLNGPLGDDMVVELLRPPDLRWKVRVQRERLRR